LEFGTTDLSARVTNPLPVTAPPGGWNVTSAELAAHRDLVEEAAPTTAVTTKKATTTKAAPKKK
jgi:hypothetical protein